MQKITYFIVEKNSKLPKVPSSLPVDELLRAEMVGQGEAGKQRQEHP